VNSKASVYNTEISGDGEAKEAVLGRLKSDERF
jgi:hypothetical protein